MVIEYVENGQILAHFVPQPDDPYDQCPVQQVST